MKIDNYVNISNLNNLKIQNKTSDDKPLREQTDAFEAFLLKQVLDIAMKEQNSIFPKAAGSEIYKSMQTDALSKSLAGKFGFSDLLYDYLKAKEK